MLKILNVKTTGEVQIICTEGLLDIGVVTDITDEILPRSARDSLEDLIENLQANSFYEIHMEETNGKAFTHKVGTNSFESYDYADHKLFQTLSKWGAKIETD